MQAGFDTLVEAGYAPEMAYFECTHEVKLIVDLVYEGGIADMRYSVSNTAEYGDLSMGHRIIDDHVKQNMRELLKDIQSGRFVREWMSECETGELSFKALRRRSSEHGSEEAGAHLRAMMPWLAENKLVDKTKNNRPFTEGTDHGRYCFGGTAKFYSGYVALNPTRNSLASKRKILLTKVFKGLFLTLSSGL